MLNERAQILLKTLVERYIHEGQPVGSRALSKFSGLDLSPATIRNVMADLEEMGLVASPHTSAGRVPTPKGYRLFVDTLLVVKTLDKMELHHLENHLHPDNPSRVINVASQLLSELTRFAGVVITPKRKGAVFRHIEFMALSEKRILLILVTPEGDVQNRIIFTNTPYSQSDLIEAGNFINQHYAGCTLDEIRGRLDIELKQLRSEMTSLMSAAIEASGDAINESSEAMVLTGEHNLLQIDDLSDNLIGLKKLFELFERKTKLLQLLELSRQAHGVKIFIGGESDVASLEELSVVTAPYEIEGEIVGTVGVIGPRRMAYERVIPIVDITAARQNCFPAVCRNINLYPKNNKLIVMTSQSIYQHGSPNHTGVLLINLGTPDAPTAQALRPYLKEFLSNPRVIEVPRLIWWPILHGFILPFRPKASAEKYAKIWIPEGSPLKVHTERQTERLREALAARLKNPPIVEYAMNIGKPSVASVLTRMQQQGCERILVIPLFPQYAASSTAAAMDNVFAVLNQMRNQPALRTVKQYHDHPGYIAALAQNVRDYWDTHGRPDKLIISFHGTPRASLDKGDPYHCVCQKTGRLLAEALELNANQYAVCFQSRFGRAQWLTPYTAVTLEQLGKEQTQRVDVICPGFVSDCLETLEEIAIEAKHTFIQAGGKEFHYIPCLNERSDWIQALADITCTHLQGWLDIEVTEEAAQLSRKLALEMGAKD